jgi:ribosomal protein S18 acetylase RimI-like enzyme
MCTETRDDAVALIGAFLGGDQHYLASSVEYGDGGPQALRNAMDLFLAHPELGFVWLAFAVDALLPPKAVGACVVCYAISTARGKLVAKLDDVTVDPGWQGQGVGNAMLKALMQHLQGQGVSRIDTSCHRDNADAWRFYERLGFKSLTEERIALLLP